jgi:hypothetical protein
MPGTVVNTPRWSHVMKRDRWDFWVDLIIPIGAVLVFLFSMSTIFFDRHHAGEAAHAPAHHNQ